MQDDDEDRLDRLCGMVERIDERTEKTHEEVEHLMRIVALGNGDLPLTTKVAKLDERLRASVESRAARWKFRGVILMAFAGIIVAVTNCIAGK